MRVNPEDITQILKHQIEHYSNSIQMDEIGTVLTVGDGIARVYGLDSCVSNELLEFPNGIYGMALNLEKDSVVAVLLGDDTELHEGDIVKRTGNVVSVPVGESLLSRVVNALGVPLDEKGPIYNTEFFPIERPATGIIERESVSEPLLTGIKAIDSMIPIGLGQRELIIGDRQTGKTAIAIDTIINQKNKDMICFYVAIGQKQSTVVEIVEKLTKNGAMPYTTIISATAADSVAMQYIAPYSACSMAEYFMEQGKDVLIVYDDLSKHAVAYRTISLLIRRPPGREAYPGDVFYLHSRLLERSARRASDFGGGSITALPIIETQSGDVSAYIPTNVISITDGQLFLETEFFHEGIIPAIDPGISVSRVGGNAQIPSIRKISGKLKLLYSQYQELAAFSQFGSDLDKSTQKRLTQGEQIVEALKQSESSPVDIALQVCLFYGLINDLLIEIPPKQMKKFEFYLYDFLQLNYSDFLGKILSTGTLTKQQSEELEKIIKQAQSEFSIKNNDQRL